MRYILGLLTWLSKKGKRDSVCLLLCFLYSLPSEITIASHIFFPIASLNGFFLVFKVSCWLGFKYTNSNIFASTVSQSFISCYPTPSTARSLPSHDPTLLISLFQSHKIHYPYSTKSSAPQTLARQKAYAVPGCGGSMVQLVV